jgi:ABC-type transport system involved in cytochrome c biogenesis permease subunit
MLKFCASLPLAIALMIVLMAVLTVGTCVENWYGPEAGPATARSFVYGTWWFSALAALLALNVFAALAVRFPWKKRQTGFVLTHVGLLVLLLGCLLTRRWGIDASLSLFEGQAASVAVDDASHEAFDLGVQVLLRKARRSLYPGSRQASNYSSTIDLLDRHDAARCLQSDVLVTMNQPVDFTDPATGRSYRLFQSGLQGPFSAASLHLPPAGSADPPPRVFLSTLTVNHDPGRTCKYFGCLMIVCGIFCTYFLKPLFRKGTNSGATTTLRMAPGSPGSAAGLVAIFIVALLSVGGTARAADAAGPDWGAWRRLPVLDDGRIMPLDSFARKTIQEICGGQAPPAVPSGGAAELLLSWLVEPERWERVPFLPASDAVLRSEWLGVPLRDEAGRPLRCVSPRQVAASLAKFHQRLEELEQIDQRRQQARAADRPADPSKSEKESEPLWKAAEQLLAAYHAYRTLTFQPAAARGGRSRFNEKLSGVIRDWNDLRGSLIWCLSPDERGGNVHPAERAESDLRKLVELADQTDAASLDALETRAASLERSTADLAGRTAALVERMVRSPPPLKEAALRAIRMEIRDTAARAGELARHAAAARLALYDDGLALRLAPALNPDALEAARDTGDDAQPWAALQTLIHGSDGLMRRYPQPELKDLRGAYLHLAAAYRDHDDPQRADRLDDALQAFAAALRQFGQAVEPIRRRMVVHERDEAVLAATAYPPPGSTGAEVVYNRLDPLFWSWAAAAASVACLAVSLRLLRRPMFWLGMAALGVSQGLIVTGFSMRVYITGWAPVTNMFETIVFVALCAEALGTAFTLLAVWRGRKARRAGAAPPEKTFAPAAVALLAALVALLALLTGYYVPAFPKDIRPLTAVLRNNVLLSFHVLTIVAGYGAGALAWILGNITLGFHLFGRRTAGRPPAACAALGPLIYRLVQIAVLLLAVGTMLGALWADLSWGRFWGWDPKEVWALIALLGYLAVLHSRFAGWVKQRGLAALAVGCFALVIVAWYGVNFVLGAGLHSYGFGGGGKLFMGSLIGVESLYVAVALWRSRKPLASGRPHLRIANTPDDDAAPASSEAA